MAGLPGEQHVHSFGNLAVNPEAALLFIDFVTAPLHLSGVAGIEWAGRAAGRRRPHRPAAPVFDVQRLVAGRLPRRVEVAPAPTPVIHADSP